METRTQPLYKQISTFEYVPH